MKMRSSAARFIAAMSLAAAAVTTVVACSKSVPNSDDAIAPETGSPMMEAQVSNNIPQENNSEAFVAADSVRVRTSPEGGENAPGRLFANDKVQVIDATPVGKDEYISIRIVDSSTHLDHKPIYYVARKFLNAGPLDGEASTSSSLSITPARGPFVEGQVPVQANRLFIVTNIATERIRVYQRCTPEENCVNRMIMEASVINGESEDGTRTNVGYFQVSSWTKFYEQGPYPAWYKEGYPPVPAVGDRSGWISSKYFPNGQGESRGGFGWYTAKVTPNAFGQWTHGTYGWGADKTSLIDFKDSFAGAFLSIFANIRSHGCTRVDNESIAYLRQLIAIGTPLVKVYAVESYRDPSRAMYSQTRPKWDYILTKNGAQQINNHQLADRATVLAAGTPKSEWIEEGTYSIDQYPDAVTGDLYRLNTFHGEFLVDEGTFYNYEHPENIIRGGHKDIIAPPYMITTTSPAGDVETRRAARTRVRSK